MHYDRTNAGAMFRNLKKAEPGANPNLPDYRGNCEVGGVQYNIAGWLKTAQKTETRFLSMKFTPKDEDVKHGHHPPLPPNTNPTPPAKPPPADLPF